MLKIEHLSKKSFIHLLQYILFDIGVEKVCFSHKTPEGKKVTGLMNNASLDIPLSGRKHTRFIHKGKSKEVYLNPGDIHYTASKHWKQPLWDSVHKMSSIVYYHEYVRITYIDFDDFNSGSESHLPADIFYHTSNPLNMSGTQILRILEYMTESEKETGAVSLVRALLEITLETLINDSASSIGKAEKTYTQIKNYLFDHFGSPINRSHVANVFQLNPSYISRLFNERGSECFNEMLRRLRIEHAALLLRQTNMSLDEITDCCGYLSSTYFSSAFHKYFGLPPGKYRISGPNSRCRQK